MPSAKLQASITSPLGCFLRRETEVQFEIWISPEESMGAEDVGAGERRTRNYPGGGCCGRALRPQPARSTCRPGRPWRPHRGCGRGSPRPEEALRGPRRPAMDVLPRALPARCGAEACRTAAGSPGSRSMGLLQPRGNARREPPAHRRAGPCLQMSVITDPEEGAERLCGRTGCGPTQVMDP